MRSVVGGVIFEASLYDADALAGGAATPPYDILLVVLVHVKLLLIFVYIIGAVYLAISAKVGDASRRQKLAIRL